MNTKEISSVEELTCESSRSSTLEDGRQRPFIISPPLLEGDPMEWIRENAAQLNSTLNEERSVLLRGFSVSDVRRFKQAVDCLGSDLLDYSERSTPRSLLESKVYTSTEYPKNHEIPMHNENSYSLRWPRRLFFCCLLPAARGGETPIADSRKVFERLDRDLREKFLKKQVMYVRNYGLGVDLSWEEAFQTSDKSKVEAYCESSDISFEWFENGNCLRTRQVRPAAMTSKETGEKVWFNQAHLFHISSLDPMLRESLEELFSEEQLPRNACFGDGTSISDEEIECIREAYRKTRVPVSWEQGDFLMLDNLYFAHGRYPFEGERKVVVSMDGVGAPSASPIL